jgi:DNA-3-methyladenine glycosylase II
MRQVHRRTGLPPLRDFSADFAGLCRIVTGQQLSASSAAAIWGRFARSVVPFEAAGILALSDAELRRPGLSSGKIRTIRAIAAAVADGQIDFARLNAQPDAEIMSQLTRLHGIGPWTAEIYLLFALRRADAFPAGDLALQVAVQRLMRLPERPSAPELAGISQRWRPFRGAAARLLWAEYALQQRKPAAAAHSPPSKKRKVQ